LARLSIEAKVNEAKIDPKAAKAILDPKKNIAANALDIALFGRMVAEAPELNVDAACQVAHAISIHRADTEFDYFTAVDDCAPDENAGAGMIGTIEYVSSTLYRYATVDVPHLRENLGHSTEATIRAVRTFADSFVLSMPTGKQNTFANRTLPSAVIVQLRNTQPVSLVNAFEQPIEVHDSKGRTELACEALVQQGNILNRAFGVTPVSTFVVLGAPNTDALIQIGEPVSLDELEDRLDDAIRTWSQS
jgi:CRISPR system Cascade subunit CasC